MQTNPEKDWSEFEDDLSDAIGDSMDYDWTYRDGARAVVLWLNENAPRMSSQIHSDMTAWRAVDACGGTYTPAQEASGYAQGHRDALDAASDAVRLIDDLTAEALKALDNLTFTVGVTAIKHADQLPALEQAVVAARAVIAKATKP